MSKEQFEKSLQSFRQELSKMHTNRANPNIVEGIHVQAYDSTMKIVELANISTPEPQLLVIQPWDASVMQAIESALRASDLHLSPVVDGDIIRISFPPLTEERRKELVKIVHQKAEDCRIAIRKTREELLKELKQMEKDGDISEDDYFREEKEIQQTVDTYNQKVKDIGEKKETELMTI